MEIPSEESAFKLPIDQIPNDWIPNVYAKEHHLHVREVSPNLLSGKKEGEDYIITNCQGFIYTPRNTETFHINFADLRKYNKGYYARNFTKTQAFEPEETGPNAAVHMTFCDFLNDVRKEGLANVNTDDEGEYCETGDKDLLIKNFKENYDVIASVGKQLAGLGWEVPKKPEPPPPTERIGVRVEPKPKEEKPKKGPPGRLDYYFPLGLLIGSVVLTGAIYAYTR